MVKGFFSKLFGGGAHSTKEVNTAPASTYDPVLKAPRSVLEKARSVTGFDFETCHGKDAFTRWQEIKAKGEAYPVIIGDEEELVELIDRFKIHGGIDLSETDFDAFEFPDKFLAKKEKEAADYYDVHEDAFNLSKAVNGLIELWVDEPYGEPAQEPLSARDFRGKYFNEVFIALIPTDDWTTLPALLRFGGWNDCPSDEWHISALRYWDRHYGLSLVSMTHDVIELQAKHRPQLLRDAVTLAMEQYYYCADIVTQGVDDPANLAKQLMQSNFWYFWWD